MTSISLHAVSTHPQAAARTGQPSGGLARLRAAPARAARATMRAAAAMALPLAASLAGSLATLCCPSPASASGSGVVISQVYGGNGGTYASDYVELFNAGTTPVSINGWSVQYASAGGTGNFAGNGVVAVSGILQPGQYHLVKLDTSATGSALPVADSSGSIGLSSSAGKVILANVSTGLACNGGSTACSASQLAQIVDLVGYGASNFFEGSAPAPGLTSTTAALRAAAGCTDSDQNGTDFSAGPPGPRNSASALQACGGPGTGAPIVASCPAALSVVPGAVLDFPLAASDPDNRVNAASIIGSPTSGISLTQFSPAAANGASASARLSLDGSTAIGTWPVVVQFGNDGGQAASCTVSLTIADAGNSYTPIYTIQGNAAQSLLTGIRTTRGVVTKVNNNGYFIQDATGDGDPDTSDGIFVFTSTAPYVQPGKWVQITGNVTEFNTGAATNPVTLANPVTEFNNITATTFLGTGTITPTLITLPVAVQGGLEKYEGMLVTITSPLTVSQNYFLGRYGQATLSSGGRLLKPTNQFRPGTPQAVALADQNARASIMLDDGSSQQNINPTPYLAADNTMRAGDVIATLTGVIDYGLATNSNTGIAMYRIHPTDAPQITRANPRTVAPPAVAGNVRVASFNVLNFFTTFTDGTTAAGGSGQGCAPSGTTADCRGADSAAEFIRQRTKIVKAMAAINADVFGLMEIQNNGDTAAQNLVTALNAEINSASGGSGATYAVVPAPATTGTDAIRVAMVYKPGALTLAGVAMSDSNPIHNRPPFAQTFRLANGEKFSVVVNHFKSKSSCPTSVADPDADSGDGQGCWNNRRRQQATALLAFIASVQATAGDNDVLAIGDLNAYGQEDPVHDLTEGGLVDQVARFNAADYSYVFDGESGYIDHGLATASLSAQTVGTTHWHINADEPSVIDYNTEFRQPACAACGPDYYSPTPYRASDHDPVIVGLQLGAMTAQTISFDGPANRPLASGGFFVTATASSGLAVSFQSATGAICTVTAVGQVSLLNTGSCTLLANQPGDAVYGPAPEVSRTFDVTGSQVQTINFAPLSPRAIDNGSFALSVTSSSGLPIAFSSLTPEVCAVGGSTVTLIATGACTIAADQPGDAAFAPATRVTQTFAVIPAGTGGGAVDGDVPTLPEWAAVVLGLALFHQAARRNLGSAPPPR